MLNHKVESFNVWRGHTHVKNRFLHGKKNVWFMHGPSLSKLRPCFDTFGENTVPESDPINASCFFFFQLIYGSFHIIDLF